MSDQLEDFIRDNRQNFDDKRPTEKVWKGIYRQLNNEEGPGFNWLWRAAAILFFLTSSYLFFQLQFLQEEDQVALNTEEFHDDFKSVESFYFQEISEKKEMIYDFEANHVKVDGAFEQDLQKLDAMYEVLKDELENNPSKKVVDALILNLLVRVDILNQQLQDMEEYIVEKKKEDVNV